MHPYAFLKFVAGPALLVCIATVVLWVRSHWVADTYGLSQHSSLATDRGEFLVLVSEPNSNFSTVPGYGREDLHDPDSPYNPRGVARHTWNVLFAHGEEFPGLHITVIRFWAIFVILICPTVLTPILFVRHYQTTSRSNGANRG